MSRPCVFCALLRDEAPAEWLVRGPQAAALLPLEESWLAPGHALVISTEHAVGVQDVSLEVLHEVATLVQQVARRLAETVGAAGVNVLNASGPHSDQSVDHLHFHVIPRWKDDGLQTWPTGSSRHTLEEGWVVALRRSLGG